MPKLLNDNLIFPPEDDKRPGLLKILERKIEEDNGDIRTQYVWKRGSFIMVVPMEADGTILVKEEFKYGQMKKMLTFAAGAVDKGETPEAAAARELMEEFGVTATEWVKLCVVSNSPDKSTEVHHLYLAKNLEKTAAPEAGTILRIPASEASALLDEQKDPHLEIALCRLALHEALAKRKP